MENLDNDFKNDAIVSDIVEAPKKGRGKKILIAILALIVLSGIGFGSFYLIKWWKYKDESPTFSAIMQGEAVGSGKVGSKVLMGGLEVTLQDVVEGSYRPLELDAEGKRLEKKYWGAKIMIFNTNQSEKEFLLFGLTDERGGKYERDRDVEFYLNELKDLGPAKEIYPRTIREGYLLFNAPEDAAKKLQLTIMSETTNKKITFDIER